MPRAVKSELTEKTLRRLLESDGYALNSLRSNGETGVDILARRGDEQIFIEVIGHKQSPPARSKDFYEVFFRAVSRLKHGARRCVIALPHFAKDGLPQRAGHYGEAWKRIGISFPELEIWLVDVERSEFRPTKWNDWID